MKRLKLALLLAALAAPAMADGPASAVPVAPTVMPSSSGTNWTGFYAGGSYAYLSGDFTWFNNGNPNGPSAYSGELAGAFVGYNRQNGNIVFGGEVAFAPGPINVFISENNTNFIDIKGRIGFAMDRVLVYGVVGYGLYTHDGSDNFIPTVTPGGGMIFGAGVDVQLTDRLFVGVEYLQRSGSGEYDQQWYPDYTFETSGSTISARAGFRF